MSNAHRLSPDELTRLRSEIKRRGLNPVAKTLGMSRAAVASVAAEVARDGSNAMALAKMSLLGSAHDPGAARHTG